MHIIHIGYHSKIRAEIDEIENRKKIYEKKNWFFAKVDKIDNF